MKNIILGKGTYTVGSPWVILGSPLLTSNHCDFLFIFKNKLCHVSKRRTPFKAIFPLFALCYLFD